jgi:outer membrane protein OmpA-like peptidoglycan-associated protein
MRIHYITILLVLSLTGTAYGQSGFEYTSKAYLKKKDPYGLPSTGAYALSTQKYKDKYGETPVSGAAMLQLGDNYRLNGQPMEAALWYSRGIDQARVPEDYLHFAHVLKMIGQCDEANNKYRQYLKAKGEIEADICTPIEAKELDLQVNMEILAFINSEGSDFAAVPWGDKLLFTSDRSFSRPGVIQDPWTMRNFTGIFLTERNNEGEWRGVKRLLNLDTRYHDGTAVPDPGGDVLYFTRTFSDGFNAKDMRDLEIRQVERKGNGWKDEGRLPFSSKDYGICHPAISADGKTLVFASDMPGGLGGLDLYRVERIGKTWGAPINLGDQINSIGNEIFPSISSDGYLFYASDGIIGMGGLDVFASAPEENGKWESGYNLGPQVNTNYDDFSLVPLSGRRSGYISSNRPGGIGLDDIYFWTSNKPLGDRAYAAGDILIVDAETGLPIPGARIEFGKNILNSNDAGRLKLKSITPGMHAIKVESPGYFPGSYSVDLPATTLQTIKLNPGVYQPYIFDARDINTGLAVDNPTIELFEVTPGGRLVPMKKQISAENGATSPEDGAGKSASSPDKLPEGAQVIGGRLFQVKDNKTGAALENAILMPNEKVNGVIPNVGVKERTKWVEENYSVRRIKDFSQIPWDEVALAEANGSTTSQGTDAAANDDLPWMMDVRKRYQIRAKAEGYQSNTIELSAPEIIAMGPLVRKLIPLEPLILGIKEEDLEAGAKFRLDGIYYDYNKANIRIDARFNLDELARLMKKFPEMTIELSSHTDSRGKDGYNLDLSQRRADSAIAYLNQLGIASSRLVARGYGERQPVNHCRDGVKCSEEEHQLNRRTEFKIIKM